MATDDRIASPPPTVRYVTSPLELLKTSILFDITEFGRPVHAEMDAILSCSRTGTSTRDATVYTTTLLCHKCARRIVAAGIKRVVYIEPYPKRIADKLHSGSIRVEGHQIAAGASNGIINFRLSRSSASVRDVMPTFLR